MSAPAERPGALERVLFLQKAGIIETQTPLVQRTLAPLGVEVISASSANEIPQGARCDAIVAPTLPWLGDAIARAEGVRWIHFLSAGVDAIWEMPVQWDRFVLTKSSGVHATAMSEFCLGAMLFFVKHFDVYVDQQRRSVWERHWLGELSGGTLLVLGLGAVGGAVANLARALEMRVLGASRTGRPISSVERVVTLEAVDEILGEADYLVLCLPLTAQTRGLVGANFLARVRRGAVLVDVSRGGVVHEAALVAALKSGHLRGAALDVFESEPLDPSSELWALPNVLLTPHVAGTTPRYIERALDSFLANWERMKRGAAPVSPVDHRLGY